jgi:hypothetical protein
MESVPLKEGARGVVLVRSRMKRLLGRRRRTTFWERQTPSLTCLGNVRRAGKGYPPYGRKSEPRLSPASPIPPASGFECTGIVGAVSEPSVERRTHYEHRCKNKDTVPNQRNEISVGQENQPCGEGHSALRYSGP